MLIEIKKDIFESDNFKALNYLLQIASYKHRYKIFIDLSLVHHLSLYSRLDNDDQLFLEQAFNKFIQEDFYSDIIVSNSHPDGSFSLDEAIQYLNQPVRIILENSLNDSWFLEALFKNFKKHSKQIRRYKNQNWLIYHHGGGSTIEHSIENIKRQFTHLPKKEKFKYLRCFVLMDSDRKYPNMPLESGKQNLINYLKQNEIDFHILEKREMENYLPDEVLSELEDNDGYIKAYLNLSPVQKDFFDIEKGFPDKNFNSLFHNIQQLYEDINDDNYKILRKNTINYNDFKNEFPKLFVFSQKVTQQSLLERTKHQQNPNELQDILKRITKLL